MKCHKWRSINEKLEKAKMKPLKIHKWRCWKLHFKSDVPSAHCLHLKFDQYYDFKERCPGGNIFRCFMASWAFSGGSTYKCRVQIKKNLRRLYRILLNKTTPPLVETRSFEITRKANFCRRETCDTALEAPKCVFSTYKQHNDVRTSGTR